jgi:tetratricopeptide (TPR) repeat protein
LARKSSKEAWRTYGEECMERGMYHDARQAFRHAEATERERHAQAEADLEGAKDEEGNGRDAEAAALYQQAAQALKALKLTDRAGEAFDLAAKAFARCEMFEQAGDAYHEIKAHMVSLPRRRPCCSTPFLCTQMVCILHVDRTLARCTCAANHG